MKQMMRKSILLVLVVFLLSLGSSSVVFGQEPTEQPTEQATVQPTEQATEQPTEQATVQPTEQATEQPTEQATEQPTEQATEQPTEQATEQPTEQATEQPTEQATEQPTEQATEQATEQPTEQASPTVEATATLTPTVEATATLTPTVETTATVEADLGTTAIINPPGQSSNVLLQNTEASIANVTVTVYNSSGGTLFNNSFQIAANGARTVHAGSGTNDTGHLYMNLPNNTEASMVVQADKRLVATNVNFGSPTVHNIYEGLDSSGTATDVLLPSIQWRDAQWSIIGIQNAGSSSANVEIRYFRQDGSQIGSTITVDIPVGASNVRRSNVDVSILAEPSGVGSMRVTSTNGQALAVAVIGTLSTYTSSYDGIPASAADTKWSFPSVHRNPGGQFSHILVQNTSQTTAADVTLTYFNQAGATVDTFTNISIPAKGALTFHTTNQLSSNGGNYTPTHLGNVGSAVVQSTNGVQLVATVLETVGAAPYAYNGFNNSAGGTSVLLPSVHRNPGGQFSHALVQNTSTSQPNAITITYFKQDGSVANTFNKTLAASGSITFHTDGTLSSDGINYTPTALGNVGSAKVVSTSGIGVVAVMVETIAGLPGSYDGFK